MPASLPVSVVIPTYQREGVLLETVHHLLSLQAGPAEILVIDQTEEHEPATGQQLRTMHERRLIRWIGLPAPSIPQAMNRGLLEAREELVLFLDDDIRPEADLIAAHYGAHRERPDSLIAGRVIQPWQEDGESRVGNGFHLAGVEPGWTREFMGGNFSIPRSCAMELGGFDENFVRVAYRFEAEFAHRLRKSGRRIYFEPKACLHHLKVGSGGTRTFGEHLSTWRPDHSVGTYYFSLRTGAVREFLTRPLRAVATQYHLRRPWRIPVTFLAELQGLSWAVCLYLRGPRLMPAPKPPSRKAPGDSPMAGARAENSE